MASFLTVPKVQSWLESSKFTVTVLDESIVDVACETVFGKLHRRFDTTLWIDADSTPDLVLSILEMWYAGTYLRRAASGEDGLVSYADWLHQRVDMLCESIVDGTVLLVGVSENDDSALGSGPEFFPTDASTALWESNHHPDGSSDEVGASPRAFTMNQEF